MLIPYWAIYRILYELLNHSRELSSIDETNMIRWGWIAFGGLIGGLLLLYASLMSSHVAAYRILYGLRVRLTESYREDVAGLSERDINGSHQEDDGTECRKDRELHSPHDSRFGER